MGTAPRFDYLVIGDPVEHSRSPQMQNAAFEYYGMGSPYGKLRVDPAKIGEFVAFARENLKGVNLTVPHKQVVLPFVDELSPQAAACGSVNTLKIENGKVYGFSTDGAGIAGAVRENFSLELKDLNVLMLGAGGAATAVAFELGWRKSASLTIANRSVEKAEALAERVKKYSPELELDAVSLADSAALKKAVGKADLLLQLTSLGLHDDDPSPLDPELLKLNPELRIFDAIYKPTPLLKYGAGLGLRVADGREMLIWQGAASFEIWTGKQAPVEAMREGFKKDY